MRISKSDDSHAAKISAGDVPKQVIEVCARLRSLGHSAYVVGGAVRDSLSGRESIDWDVTTSATPQQVRAAFDRTIPTGPQHGTVTVILGDSRIEVTTMRAEGDYVDGRHPYSVCFIRDIEADLARRDFTINAMAYDPIDERLVDPFGGYADLQFQIVRAVGNPEDRFREDHLRMLRAVRIASVLGFQIDPETLSAITRCSSMMKKVSAERIRDELDKLLGGAKPSVGIELMRTTGLLEHILPELLEGYGVEQNRYHEYTIYEHNLRTADEISGDVGLRMAGLLHDVGKARTKQGEHFYGHERIGAQIARLVLRRLKYPKRVVDRVAHLVEQHMFRYEPRWSDAAVRRFIKRVGVEHLDDIFELRRADREGSNRGPDPGLDGLQRRVEEILSKGAFLTLGDLAIDGNDVKALIGPDAPRRVIGLTLSRLLGEVIEDPSLNDREKLLKRAEDIVARHIDEHRHLL
jgi:putative nucleotidyltransferase with HDIG domain